MKRYIWIAAKFAALLLFVNYCGTRLANFIVYRYMYEMPDWMHATLRFVLDHTGNEDIRDPDDLSVLALLSTLMICWIIIAIVVITLYRIAMRFVRRTLNSSGQG
ncbi:hypothetical protein V4C53_40920 [Paraburkholderia azotifigens]|uniref:hypothetical protein n=1 Tax=Paraburkholderia azotifigens TaxID=2057004 RepID=UPI000490C090